MHQVLLGILSEVTVFMTSVSFKLYTLIVQSLDVCLAIYIKQNYFKEAFLLVYSHTNESDGLFMIGFQLYSIYKLPQCVPNRYG
jgi:hypothetical protein